MNQSIKKTPPLHLTHSTGLILRLLYMERNQGIAVAYPQSWVFPECPAQHLFHTYQVALFCMGDVFCFV